MIFDAELDLGKQADERRLAVNMEKWNTSPTFWPRIPKVVDEVQLVRSVEKVSDVVLS